MSRGVGSMPGSHGRAASVAVDAPFDKLRIGLGHETGLSGSGQSQGKSSPPCPGSNLGRF